jgi:amino acid permease
MIQGVLTNVGIANAASYRIYHIVGVSLVILFPVCMLRGVDSLRYATMISIGAIIYVSIILLILLPFHLNDESVKVNIVYFKFDMNFFKAFGITFFAFYCQIGYFSAIENLLRLDELHIRKVK